MRGTKAKALRRHVRELLGDKHAAETTEYEVIQHPGKLVTNLMGQEQRMPTVQYKVKSMFRRTLLDTKKVYRRIERRSHTTPLQLQ